MYFYQNQGKPLCYHRGDSIEVFLGSNSIHGSVWCGNQFLAACVLCGWDVVCFGGETIWASRWDSWCLVLLCYYAEVLGPVDTYLGPLCVHSDPRLVLPYLVIP